MAASKRIKKTVGVWALIVLLTGSAFAKPETNVLDLIPGDSLVVVRVNQFEQSLGQMDQFLTGLSPVGLQMLIRAKLGQALGAPALPGVDLQGDFAAFAVAPEAADGTGMPNVYPGVLIPISDYKQFIKDNPNIAQPDENGVSAIGGQGQGAGGSPWLITIKAGNHALVTIGKLYPQLVQYREAMGLDTSASASIAPLTQSLSAADAKAASQAPLWIHGNIDKASQIFKPLVMGKFSQFKGMVAQKMKEEPAGPMMEMEPIFDLYGAMIEMVMDQTQSVSLSIDPQPHVLRFSKTVAAKPGTDLAGMLARDYTGQPNPLVGFARDGAAVSFAATLGDSWKTAYSKSIDWVSIMAGEHMSEEGKAQMRKMTLDVIDALNGPVAGTFFIDGTKKPHFGVQYVFSVKDENTFRALLKDSVELFNKSGFSNMYKGMGMEMDYTLKQAADTYRGVAIDSARLSMTATQPESPAGKAINGLYGGGFDYRWAITDKLCAVAVGIDVDTQIRKTIDEIKSGTLPKMSNEMKASRALIPDADKADFVLTYNYVRILNMVSTIAQSMGEDAPDINVPTSSHISIAGWGGENRGRFDMALPKQHVQEIVAAFTALQQHKHN